MNKKILKQVAKIHGVSVAEVKREMQAAIDVAFKKPNFYAGQVYSKGQTPTINEFVDHAVNDVRIKKSSFTQKNPTD